MTAPRQTKTAEIIRLIKLGVSAKEIAEKIGSTESSVRTLACQNDLSWKTRSIRKQRREDFIREAYAKNMSIADISKAIGMTIGSVKATASRIGCSKKGTAATDYRRGFSVPAHLIEDYTNLRRKGGYKARDAAVALGICEQGA